MENTITVLNIYTDNWLKQSKGQGLNLRAFEYISLMTHYILFKNRHGLSLTIYLDIYIFKQKDPIVISFDIGF